MREGKNGANTTYNDCLTLYDCGAYVCIGWHTWFSTVVGLPGPVVQPIFYRLLLVNCNDKNCLSDKGLLG